VVRFFQAAGVSQSGIHHRLLSIYGQKLFNGKEVFVWCKNFKMAERHRVLSQRNTRVDQGPRTLKKIVTVEGFIREDRRVKICETHCKETALQSFTSLGKEHCRQGRLTIVKLCVKRLNAYGDCGEVKISMHCVLTLLMILFAINMLM
jgi:hypothetical protein